MQRLYEFASRIGSFYIERSSSGSFHVTYRGECLGSYERPADAVRDLADGNTYPLVSGMKTADLSIPADISDWNRVDDL